MSNLVQRLLLFFLGVPAVIAVILFLPQYDHLAAVLATLVFTGGCARELAGLFRMRDIQIRSPLAMAFGILIPLCTYLGGLLAGDEHFAGACIGLLTATAAMILASFTSFAFAREGSIRGAISKASALAFLALYPGILGSFIVLIASEPLYATESLLSFCILAFSCDSAAWLFGMTLGRHRGVFAVSPNKSVEGFLAGLAASAGMAFACAWLFPEAIRASSWQLLVLGLVVGLTSILGDLFESAIKRSARAKDSGSAVPGRGGFLDSFDSLLFSAPVFYGLSFLFGFFR
jgi:phosphatidate cytidylyltransferase